MRSRVFVRRTIDDVRARWWYACGEDRCRLRREICRVAGAEIDAFVLRWEATRNHATVC